MARLQYNYIRTKQHSFHINSVFLFLKIFFMIQKIIMYTNFYLLDANLSAKFDQSGKEAGRSLEPIISSFRCTATLIQPLSW